MIKPRHGVIAALVAAVVFGPALMKRLFGTSLDSAIEEGAASARAGDFAGVLKRSEPCRLELPDSDALARCLNLRAEALLNLGRYDEALTVLSRARGIGESKKSARETWGETFHGIAQVEVERGDLAAAEQPALRAIDLLDDSQSVTGKESFGSSLLILGRLRRHQKRYDDAERWLRQSLRVFEEVDGHHSTTVAASSLEIAAVLDELGVGLAEARALTDLAIDVYESQRDGGHPFLGIALQTKAALLREQGQADASEVEFGLAAARLERDFPDSSFLADALTSLALFEEGRGETARAEQRYRRAIAILLMRVDPHSGQLALARSHLSSLLWAQQRYTEALPVIEAAICGPPWCTWETEANTRCFLAQVQAQVGQIEAAEGNYQKGIAALEAHLDGGTTAHLENARAAYALFRKSTQQQ